MKSGAALALVAIGLLIAAKARAAVPPPYAGNVYYPYMPRQDYAVSPFSYDAIDTFQQPTFLPWENAAANAPGPIVDQALTINPDANIFDAPANTLPDPAYQPVRFDDLSVNDMATNNLSAFLTVIRAIESNNNYNALVGGGSFSDFADHPAKLGWTGYRRPDGRLSTAAGAYQITKTTWDQIRSKLSLPDFSPASQDAAAVAITKFPWRANAFNDIVDGKFMTAISKLRNEWESFGKILAGNYPYTIPQITQMYADAGGVITGSTYT